MKEKKRALLSFFLPFLISLLIRCLLLTCKREVKLDKDSMKWSENNSVILAFWHGELLMQPYSTKFFNQIKEYFVLISDHFDGEIISKTMRYFKIDSIRGSSSKGGARALFSAIKKLEQSHTLIAITPDGPRGPYHSIADGIVFLAQKSNKPIIVIRAFYSKFWQMKSWDKFQIPKPFSKITYIMQPPLFIDKDIDLQSAKELVKKTMEKCDL